MMMTKLVSYVSLEVLTLCSLLCQFKPVAVLPFLLTSPSSLLILLYEEQAENGFRLCCPTFITRSCGEHL